MSIWAPAESPPAVAPVLLLTLGLAMLSLSWALGRVLVVTLLSCVSAAEGAMALPWRVAGSLPSLRRMLSLAGGTPLAEGEDEVGASEGGNLNLPPRRRRVVGAAFAVALRVGAFFWEGGGFLRTPAYWRMDPSSSLSSNCALAIPADFAAVVLIPSSAPLSRRLKTPVGWRTQHCESGLNIKFEFWLHDLRAAWRTKNTAWVSSLLPFKFYLTLWTKLLKFAASCGLKLYKYSCLIINSFSTQAVGPFAVYILSTVQRQCFWCRSTTLN